MDGGGTVTKDGSGSASEHCRHPPCLVAQPFVADGVDALVESMKSPGAHALGDRARLQSQLDKLTGRHDPMLITRDLRNVKVEGAFASHEDVRELSPTVAEELAI